MTAPLLVLHAYGSPAAGAPWRAALEAWDGEGDAPDLPGHGATPMPPGGYHEPADVALAAMAVLLDAGWADLPVVVGVGISGYGAEVLALAGRASGLVIIDGLGGGPGPTTADEWVAAEYAWARSVADHPGAVGAPAPGPDPLLYLGLTPRRDRGFANRVRASITVPALVLETPASPTPADEAAGHVMSFGGPVACERVADDAPATLLRAVAAWAVARAL